MASTNKTTNYELSQFIETDRPAWLTDYNGDMRTIDSTMKAISDVASGASGSISELTDRMSTAEGNITTNANDIDALEARADALEAQAQSTAGTIANIQTEQTAQNLGIEAATELGYNLARPYDSASTYAVGAYVLFQNTLYKCITAVATGEAFDPTKWIAIKATDEIAGGGYTLPVASNNVLGGIKVGAGLEMTGEKLSIYNITNRNTKALNITTSDSYNTIYKKMGTLTILTVNIHISDSSTTFTRVDYPFTFTDVVENLPLLSQNNPITAISCTGAKSIISSSTRVATAIPILAQMYVNSNNEYHITIQAQHFPFTNNNMMDAGDYFRVTFIW